MAAFAIIPAAPILLAGVDLAEAERIAVLRAAIESSLRTHATWSLPVDDLPPLAGLGGWGIDRGIDARTGELLEGDRWVRAVAELTPADRALCESAHPSIGVGLLHAHAAGVRIGPLGSSDDLLIPIDLSAASAENSPLAPVLGAAAADEQLVRAITTGDAETLVAAIAAAEDVHADLELLDVAAGLMRVREPSAYSFSTVFDERVHEVSSLCGTGTY